MVSLSPRRLGAGLVVVLIVGLLGPATAGSAAAATNPPTPGAFTGKGFDQCNAPGLAAMKAWRRHSPYRAVGIYISGRMRFCDRQPNLTPQWVRETLADGWHLLSIHVGRQAACTQVAALRRYRISTEPANGFATARAQGRAEAREAIRAARRLGLASGSTLFYDLEGFRRPGAACRKSTLTFLDGWTDRVRVAGYRSGVYSGAGSGIRLLDDARVGRGRRISLPDQIWIADWDGRASTRSAYFRHDGWRGQRIKQYRGDHDETHGGVRINIDSNYLDLRGAPQATTKAVRPKAAPKEAPKAASKATPKVTPRSAPKSASETARKRASQAVPAPPAPRRTAMRKIVPPVPLPGPTTPELAGPTTDPRCTTALVDQASYGTTGKRHRTWLHAPLQCVLAQRGLYDGHVNGYWSPATKAAVRRFQASVEHAPKTHVNTADWVSLLVAGNGRNLLRANVRGADVIRVQRALNAAGVARLRITGTFDAATGRAVRRYQDNVGLPVSGKVGAATWHHLERGRLWKAG